MTSSYGKKLCLYDNSLCPLWQETLPFMARDFVFMARDFVFLARDFARSNRIKILFFASLDTVKTIFSRRALQILW